MNVNFYEIKCELCVKMIDTLSQALIDCDNQSDKYTIKTVLDTAFDVDAESTNEHEADTLHTQVCSLLQNDIIMFDCWNELITYIHAFRSLTELQGLE